jgi:hypothetical protein
MVFELLIFFPQSVQKFRLSISRLSVNFHENIFYDFITLSGLLEVLIMIAIFQVKTVNKNAK